MLSVGKLGDYHNEDNNLIILLKRWPTAKSL
jgi:hypothetical protein